MTVTDTLPAGVTFDSATPSQGTCSESSGTVTCALGTLADGGERDRRDQGPPLDAGHDHQPGDGLRRRPATRARQQLRERQTTVDPAADLSLTKSDSPDPVLAGELLTYTLTAQNAGPSSATGVTAHRHPAGRRRLRLGDALAGQLLARRAARSPARSARSPTAPSATVEIKVRRSRRARSRTRRRVASAIGDPNSANNSASAETTVDPAADLSLTKTDSPDPVLAGRAADLQPQRRQRRPLERHRRDRHRHASAGVTFDSATPSQGSCSERAAPSPARSARSPNGRSASVEIKVTPHRAAARSRTRPRCRSAVADPSSGQQLGERHDHRRPGRRPVADEDGLARPGAGGRAAHLHA